MRTIHGIAISDPLAPIDAQLPLNAKFVAAKSAASTVTAYFDGDSEAQLDERSFVAYLPGMEIDANWEFLAMIPAPFDGRDLFFGEMHKPGWRPGMAKIPYMGTIG